MPSGLMISGASIALQALDQLLAAGHRTASPAAGATFSTGQTLPAGGAAKPLAASSATPATQFAPATLGALTALQYIRQPR